MFLLVYPIRVGSVQVQIGSGLIWFESFRVWVYIGSIRVQVSSDLIWVISNFKSLQFWVGSVLGQFNFGFRVEIGSNLSHVGSGLISDRSVQVIFDRSSQKREMQRTTFNEGKSVHLQSCFNLSPNYQLNYIHVDMQGWQKLSRKCQD